MSASLCRCQLDSVDRSSTVSRIPSSLSGGEIPTPCVSFGKEIPAVTIATHSRENSVDNKSNRSVRWRTRATAAAASLTLMSAAPAVLAGEMDIVNAMITHDIPGEPSLSIAIPIPDQGTWIFAQNGFLAPPPRSNVTVAGLGRSQGGCPSWRPILFEMVVPDGIHPKLFPRQGAQWPALLVIEEESGASVNAGLESTDPKMKYAAFLDALLRMSDGGLTCFSL